MARVRLFLAVNLPAEVRRHVYEAAAPLRDAAPSLSWVSESHLHLTLKFLGEQPPELVPPLTRVMEAVAVRAHAIRVTLSGAGAFPNFRRPRVVWMGVEPEPKLELLHHDVEIACATLGFEPEGRPFRPHLTLARVKPRDAVGAARKALARAAREVHLEEEIVVSSIDLMQSELSPAGARYTLVAFALLPNP